MESTVEACKPSPKLVSVIICTRNRGDNVLPTVRTTLACTYENVEILVMDQSDDDKTEQSLATLCETEPRLRYFRLALPGKPGALNAAREIARGRYLVLTDDDCEPDTHWLTAIVAAFAQDPRIGCVFGDVKAAAHDTTQGFIPDNPITTPASIYHLKEFLKMPGKVNFGIGANMAVRADVIAQIGGFDPCLGPGAKFGCADDHELTVRILLGGFGVHFSPDASVVHYGFRFAKHAGEDVRRTGYGFGAAFAKYLICGTIYYGSLRMLTAFLKQIVQRGLRLDRPFGFAFPLGWCKGFLMGLRHPVDRTTRCFFPVSDAQRRKYGDQFAAVVSRTNLVLLSKVGHNIIEEMAEKQ